VCVYSVCIYMVCIYMCVSSVCIFCVYIYGVCILHGALVVRHPPAKPNGRELNPTIRHESPVYTFEQRYLLTAAAPVF